jgi:hypothetical protein
MTISYRSGTGVSCSLSSSIAWSLVKVASALKGDLVGEIKCQASVAKSKWQKFYWREIDSDESKPLQPFRNHFMGGF